MAWRRHPPDHRSHASWIWCRSATNRAWDSNRPRCWRRCGLREDQGWAVSRELQAIAEFTGRVAAEDRRTGSDRSDFVVAELSAALGLTDTATFDRMVLADRLVHTLTDTFHALRSGLISFDHAKIIAITTRDLNDDLTAAVEDAVLPDMHRLTTGQLRAALKKALATADPEAFTKKCDAEAQTRRVEVWDNQFGTTDLVGRDFPTPSPTPR